MGAFDMLNVAGSGLATHQTWLDCLSYNIANVNTARPTSQSAFQAQFAEFQTNPNGGVHVSGIALGDPNGRVVYKPDDPMADGNGYVRMPDIDLGSQMSQLIMAQRGFQASVQVTKDAQDSYTAALQIGKS